MPRESHKEQVLLAARRLFIRNGYKGTSLRAIAGACGMTMGAIYHHFRSKNDLYLSVLADNDLTPHLEELAGLVSDPAFPHNLKDIGRAIWKVARENKDFFKLVYVDILEFDGRNVKKHVQDMRRITAAIAQELLETRINKGEIADLDPRVMFRCLTDTFLHYYLEEMMLNESLGSDVGLSDDEVAEQLAQVLLYGIVRRHVGG